ncbi:MAG: hypothetical protein ACRD1C_06205 [Terriglobales bacterium]
MPIPPPAPPAVVGLDCAAFERLLADVLDRDRLPLAGRQHLLHCAACDAVLSAYEAIAAQVRQLPPADAEPASDLWPEIAARLREEGIIHSDLEACDASLPAPQLVHRTPAPRR